MDRSNLISSNRHTAIVYGTLMQGERAAHFLEGASYLGRCQLPDHAMYHLGSYPGIQPCVGETVYGELYLISDEMLRKLDQYEDEGTLYDRKVVTVWMEDRPIEASAYIYKKSVADFPIMRKAWNERS